MLAAFLLAGLVSSASHAIVLQTPGRISVTWDQNDPANAVTNYLVLIGQQSRVYSQTFDVGLIPAYTTDILQPGTYYVAVAAKNGTATGPVSAEVSADAPYQDPCVGPLGASAVSIFVTKLLMSGPNVGAQGTLYFQLGSPDSPIIAIQTSVNGQPADTPSAVCTASDKSTCTPLTRIGASWFTTPSVAGTYPVSVTAMNAVGCSATATKDALGNLLTVTVK